MRNWLKKCHDLFWVTLPLIAAAALALLVVRATFPNSDTFFIIRTGAYIAENGVVPTVNPFVIHEGFGIIVQQWLFDVLVYKIYDIGGNLGLYIYSAVALLAWIFMLYKFFGLYSNNTRLKVLLLSLCSVIASMFVVVRPTSLSFLMCLSVIMIMETYRKNRRARILLLLPPLSLLTVNLHASMWPLLFVLMVPFVFPDRLPQVKELGVKKGLWVYVRDWFAQWRLVLLAVVCMVLAGLVNPNGLNGMRYLLLSYGSATTSSVIAELKPPEVNSFIGILIIISIVFLFQYVNKFGKDMDFAKFYMAAGTIILAMMHNRDVWFLIFGIPPIALVLLQNFSWKEKKRPEKSKNTISYAILDICYLCIIAIFFVPLQVCGSLSFPDSGTSPVDAVAYLEKFDKDKVVLFTEFNNGAFMELNGYQVYMDARPELFQKKINGKEDVYTEYLSVCTGKSDFEAFFEKYGFTHLVVLDGTPLSGFMKAYDGYTMVVDGEGYCLYEHSKP